MDEAFAANRAKLTGCEEACERDALKVFVKDFCIVTWLRKHARPSAVTCEQQDCQGLSELGFNAFAGNLKVGICCLGISHVELYSLSDASWLGQYDPVNIIVDAKALTNYEIVRHLLAIDVVDREPDQQALEHQFLVAGR